jgi:hypothetical protein
LSQEIAVLRTPWKQQMRALRDMLMLTQDELAAALNAVSVALLADAAQLLSSIGLSQALGLTGEEICRFESGARRPKRRSVYLMLALSLRRLGALRDLAAVNDWLDAAHQGWLTGREAVVAASVIDFADGRS